MKYHIGTFYEEIKSNWGYYHCEREDEKRKRRELKVRASRS